MRALGHGGVTLVNLILLRVVQQSRITMNITSTFTSQCAREARSAGGSAPVECATEEDIAALLSPTLPSPLSPRETFGFFAGLPSRPLLIAHTGTPWKEVPRGPWDVPYTRELRVVGEHAIAAPGVWEKQVGPALLKILDEANVQWNTIDAHRIPYLDVEFRSHDETPGPAPVVVCIGVKLGTLSGKDGAIVAKRCQEALDTFGLNDVEIAIKASQRFQLTAPAFEGPSHWCDSDNPATKLRIPFTSAAGFPLSTEARPDVEGSSGFFFINGEDTSKVYLLTARHVVLETASRDNNTVYDHEANIIRRRRNVTVFGDKGIADHMRDIRVEIGRQVITIEIYQHWIGSEQDADPAAVAKLKDTQGLIEKAREAMKVLEKRYEDVAKLYLSKFGRTLGFVSYAPPLGFSLGEHMYSEDVAVIEVDADKIDAKTFRSNVLDLGFEFELSTLTMMMDPHHYDSERSGPPLFKFPLDRLLELRSIIPDSELRDPKDEDSNGDRCIVVLKRGRTTGLTVGRINNLPSYTRTYWEDGTANVSMEWPIFKYSNDRDRNKRMYGFSEPGDSGSVVVDGRGRIAGIITGGAGYTPALNLNDRTPVADVTYMTAAAFIHSQMLARGIDMNVNFTLS